MPVIHGRYYMNPAMGAAVERARAAEEAPKDGGNAGSERDAHGRFVPSGAVHHVEIEVADGGYLARLHRHPQGGNASGPAHGGPPNPSSHVFTDHHDLVEFLRSEFNKNK